MIKYKCVRELIFRLFRDVSLGCFCPNSLIASATTTSRNLTPAPRGCKIACKRVLFFDHGWAGYLIYLGSPTSINRSFYEKRVPFLKLIIYVTMCIFMMGLVDVGCITHDVFLIVYLLTLTVKFYNNCCRENSV